MITDRIVGVLIVRAARSITAMIDTLKAGAGAGGPVGWRVAQADWRSLKTARVGFLLAATLVAAAAPGPAFDGSVMLSQMPPVASSYASFPRIENPTGEAEERINALLQSWDELGRQHYLRFGTGWRARVGQGKVSRWIKVVMHGPRYLSFAVTDGDPFYDGSVSSFVLHQSGVTFDLRTGALVDWTTVLPPALTGDADREEKGRPIEYDLKSSRLWQLFAMNYQDGSQWCRDWVQRAPATNPIALRPFLDATAGGLALVWDIGSRDFQNCTGRAVVPIGSLRTEGMAADAVSALEIAIEMQRTPMPGHD